MTNRYLPGAAESAKASEPMVINVHKEDSNENERHRNNPDEVRSVSSARSRASQGPIQVNVQGKCQIWDQNRDPVRYLEAVFLTSCIIASDMNLCVEQLLR